MYLLNCSGSINNNIISENTAQTVAMPPYGGGIYLLDCDDVVLSSNVIQGNGGALSGGGVLVENSYNIMILSKRALLKNTQTLSFSRGNTDPYRTECADCSQRN